MEDVARWLVGAHAFYCRFRGVTYVTCGFGNVKGVGAGVLISNVSNVLARGHVCTRRVETCITAITNRQCEHHVDVGLLSPRAGNLV